MEHIIAKLEHCSIKKNSDKEIKRPGLGLLSRYVHLGNGQREGMKQRPSFPFKGEDNKEMGIHFGSTWAMHSPQSKAKTSKRVGP